MNNSDSHHPLEADMAAELSGFDGFNLVQPGEMPVDSDAVPWWKRPIYRLAIVGVVLFIPIFTIANSVTGGGARQAASEEAVASTASEPSESGQEVDRLLQENMLLQQRVNAYEGTRSELPMDGQPSEADGQPSLPPIEVPETPAAATDEGITDPSAPVATAPSLSANERWSRASGSGSFGSIPGDQVAAGPLSNPAAVTPTDNPGQVPALTAQLTSGERQRYNPFSVSETFDTPGLDATGEGEAISSVPGSSVPGSSVAIDSEAENFILHGVIRRTVPAGATATGTFDAPFYWVPELGDISYRIVTDAAVNDRQGNVAFPTGTTFVSSVEQVLDNGLVLLAVREAITPDGVTTPLEGVSVKGEAGHPLVAQQQRITDGVARRDVMTAVLGGLSAAADELTRASSSSSYSFSSIGSAGRTTIDDDSRNPGAAFVGGGIDAVLPDIQQRNRDAVRRLQETEQIWTLDPEQPVEIVFNQTVQL
ncbi:MAG: hypothetical protein AB4050_08965 [Synechococcus sp.]